MGLGAGTAVGVVRQDHDIQRSIPVRRGVGGQAEGVDQRDEDQQQQEDSQVFRYAGMVGWPGMLSIGRQFTSPVCSELPFGAVKTCDKSQEFSGLSLL